MSRWQLWQKMTRVLGTMAQVGLEEIGRSAPVRPWPWNDVERLESWEGQRGLRPEQRRASRRRAGSGRR